MRQLTRLFWLGLKSQPNSYGSRSGRSGQLTEHTQAVRDNVAFDLERAIAPSDQKVLTEGSGQKVAVIG